MPLPSPVQTTDSFNTWIDATNNVITHVANTNKYILLSQNATPEVSSGNGAVNGTFIITGLVVNSSANIAGTTAEVSANLTIVGTTTLISSNTTIGGTTLVIQSNVSVSGDTLVFTGSSINVTTGSLYVGNTANVIGILNVSGNTLSGNLTVSGATSLATVNASGLARFASNVHIVGKVTTNGEISLAGPLHYSNTFTETSSAISGTYNDLSLAANTVVLRVNAASAANLTSISTANADIHRQVVVFNTSNFDVTLIHNSGSGTANNRFICPSNTDFTLQKQGSAVLYYDPAAKYWRVLVGSSAVLPNTAILTTSTTGINASALSTGTVPNARLDSNIIFTTSTTGINAAALINTIPAATLPTTGVNAGTLSTGTLPLARLDANVILTTSTTGINASALSVGTVPNARLDSNIIFTTSTTGINASAISAGTVSSARLPVANTSQSGIVSTSAQSFAGLKTFTNGAQISGSNLTVDGGGQINGANQALSGFLFVGGKLYFDTTGRVVLPVGTDKWAT